MFSKILVPIQDMVADQIVFEQALVLAKQNQAGLMFLHVLSPEMRSTPSLPAPVLYNYPMVTDELMLDYRTRWENVETQGLELLKGLAAKAEAEGITAEFSQNVGNSGKLICSMAKTWGADLIMTQQPDRSKLDELFLGSVSRYVMHHAPCPILAIPRAAGNVLD